MPFYEYECSSCKFYSEIMQKIDEAPIKKCPSCGRNTLKKLISAPVFRLKGAGWYETDFKGEKENKRNLAEVASKEEPKKDAATETKTEPKAQAKPESQPEKKKPIVKKPATRSVVAKPVRKLAGVKQARRKAR